MKRNGITVIWGVLIGMLALVGCGYNAVHGPNRVDTAGEGSMVFVRPDRFTVLGTRSLSDYVEVTFEEASVGETGRMEVSVGLRNRGGTHVYDKEGQDIAVGAQIAFYGTPNAQGRAIWRSPRKTVVIRRGATEQLDYVCPKAGAQSYQITLSDYDGVE